MEEHVRSLRDAMQERFKGDLLRERVDSLEHACMHVLEEAREKEPEMQQLRQCAQELTCQVASLQEKNEGLRALSQRIEELTAVVASLQEENEGLRANLDFQMRDGKMLEASKVEEHVRSLRDAMQEVLAEIRKSDANYALSIAALETQLVQANESTTLCKGELHMYGRNSSPPPSLPHRILV